MSSVAHLQDRRTGRPRGARSAPAWLRAARWAHRNLGKPEAVPPSALAGRLLALGQEHPDRLAVCLDKLEATWELRAAPSNTGVVQDDHDDAWPRRVKTLTVPLKQLVLWMAGQAEPLWMASLPAAFEVAGCEVNTKRRQITLTIRSRAFEPVPEGSLAPELEWDRCGVG